MSDKTLIVITGPTAVGKTALAIEIAQRFNTEIISADSRQFYREMSIGTAKPSQQELSTVKHHFIDSHSIHEEFTVGDFETAALDTINTIFKTHSTAILAGGSGLYIKAVTEGFDNLPKSEPHIREELNELFQSEGVQVLAEKLRTLDPHYYNEVDLNNPQRIIRALEVSLSTGKPFSSLRTNEPKIRPFKTIKIGLNTNREILYNRINFRVDEMIRNGLVDEVRSLLPYRKLNTLNTVGYSELFDFFDKVKSLGQAVDQIKQNTRRFAKRQLTWFRKDPQIKWFEPEQLIEVHQYIADTINKTS